MLNIPQHPTLLMDVTNEFMTRQWSTARTLSLSDLSQWSQDVHRCLIHWRIVIPGRDLSLLVTTRWRNLVCLWWHIYLMMVMYSQLDIGESPQNCFRHA